MDITIVGPNLRNTSHGKTFEIHKSGCKDLRRFTNDQQWQFAATTQVEVCDEIYPPNEFECKSGEFLYDIHFAPCCKELR